MAKGLLRRRWNTTWPSSLSLETHHQVALETLFSKTRQNPAHFEHHKTRDRSLALQRNGVSGQGKSRQSIANQIKAIPSKANKVNLDESTASERQVLATTKVGGARQHTSFSCGFLTTTD